MTKQERDRVREAAATSKMMKAVSQPPSAVVQQMMALSGQPLAEIIADQARVDAAKDGECIKVANPAAIVVRKPAKRKTIADHEAVMAGRGRLPVGSQDSASWDGEKWIGNLIVPVGEQNMTGNFKTFHGSAPGRFELLHKLTQMYCEWKAQTEAK